MKSKKIGETVPYPSFSVLILTRRCKRAATSRNRAVPPIML